MKKGNKESPSDTSLQLDANVRGTFCSPDEECSLCGNDAVHKCDFISDKSSSDDAE